MWLEVIQISIIVAEKQIEETVTALYKMVANDIHYRSSLMLAVI